MLSIYKEGNKNFQHEATGYIKPYGASDITIIFDGDTVKLRSVSGRPVFDKDGYNYSDVNVYNEGGSVEVFTSVVDLKQRLINLGYPFQGGDAIYIAQKEEEILGTATYSSGDTGAVSLDLNTFADTYRILTGDTAYTFTNTPNEGFSIARSMTLKGEFNPSFTGATIVGEYLDDGSENDIELKFTNYPTVGLRVWVYINQENG